MDDHDYIQTVREVYDYHKTNQPPAVPRSIFSCYDYVHELNVNIPELIEQITGVGKYNLYKIYCKLSTMLSNKLDEYIKNRFDDKLNQQVICSRARLIKQCSEIIKNRYDYAISKCNKEFICKRKTFENGSSNVLDIIEYLLHYADACVVGFRNEMHLLLRCRYKSSSHFPFGLLDGIDIDNYDSENDIAASMGYIIPNTDITVFEFLFMDFDPTHLPILDHEKLMIEKFKTLEYVIKEQCMRLNTIYNDNIADQDGEDSEDSEDIEDID